MINDLSITMNYELCTTVYNYKLCKVLGCLLIRVLFKIYLKMTDTSETFSAFSSQFL